MKLEWNRKYTTIAVYIALVLLAASFVVFFFINNNDFGAYVKNIVTALNPVLYGIVIAYLLNPVVKIFDTKIFVFLDEKPGRRRLRRALSVFSTMLIFAGFIGLIMSALIPQLVSSVTDFQVKFEGYTVSLKAWLEMKAANSKYLGQALYSAIEYIEGLLEKTGELADIVLPWIGSIATTILEILKNALIGIVFALLILCTKEKFGARAKKICRACLSDERCEKFLSTASKADRSFGGYIKGTLLDAVLVGVVTFFLMWIIGVPYYPLIAIILALTNMIPIFGPYIGSIPSGLIIFIADPLKVIPFAIMVVCVQLIDGNMIAPRLLGSNIGLRSEWVVIAITVMSGFFGALGMIIGVPIFAVIYTLLSEWVDGKLAKRSFSPDGTDYCSDEGRAIFLEATETRPKKEPVSLRGLLKKKKRKDDTK